MRKTERFFNILVILMLVIMTLGSPSLVAQAKNDNQEPKADPRLLQMAEENPKDTFRVIVQREMKNRDLPDDNPEAAVEKGGGRVKKQLRMVESFSAELTGKEITKLAKNPKVRWISADAPMLSTAAAGMETVRDEFTSKSYDGNNGTATWTSNWEEAGETTNATSDLIQVVENSSCADGSEYCLRLDPYAPVGKYVYRQANLSGVVSVWLSFYRNNRLNDNYGIYEQVQLQVSSDGGGNWTTLRTYSSRYFTGAATDSFDISAYASSNTQIRFLINKYQTGARYIYFDNIEIAFARPSAFLSTIKADQLGLNGSGVTVAVVDSGLTTKNNDFISGTDSRIIASAGFGDQINSTSDLYGHGTHVAGIIGGNGAASNGIYKGVAPGVNLINLKVSDKDGMTYESSLIDSLQWIYNNKDLYNIRVVNISMNSTVAQSYHTSPLDAAVEILWFNGIVVVVSAGNNGTADGPSIIYPPANDPFVITVGATEDKGTGDLGDDNLAIFSAYGLTDDGFAKPDLVAPGRNVIAPLSEKTSTIFTAHPVHRVGDYYFRMSGTSMSAPMVSGAVALLLQDEPYLNPDQVKYRLTATANQNWNYYASQSGAGYLDVYAAVYGTTTESANQGIMPSLILATGNNAIDFNSVGWNSVGWNSVGWNSVGWNSVGWNSVGWNSVGWNSVGWNSVGWNSVGWNSSTWDD
jgi:serine protease AprX